ncbi:mCG145496, partial [Mus musculus]
ERSRHQNDKCYVIPVISGSQILGCINKDGGSRCSSSSCHLLFFLLLLLLLLLLVFCFFSFNLFIYYCMCVASCIHMCLGTCNRSERTTFKSCFFPSTL